MYAPIITVAAVYDRRDSNESYISELCRTSKTSHFPLAYRGEPLYFYLGNRGEHT
jgi:hypothetical protein